MSRLAALSVFFLLSQFICVAQTPIAPGSAAPATVPEPPLPIPIQIKKNVVFLNTSCVHDFTNELRALKSQLAQMPVQQKMITLQQLTPLTSRLAQIPQSLAKLNKEEVSRLNRIFVPNVNDSAGMTDEIAWRADALAKMSLLSKDEISSLTPESRSLLPADTHLGTGFFVVVPDARANPRATKPDQTTGFLYLVTNRHLAEPGIESGQPCQVLQTQITINRKADASHPASYAETSAIPRLGNWTFSDDDSVDLAVTPLGVPNDVYDYIVVKTDSFVGDEEISKKRVVEGDPVMFSGLFIQSFMKTHRLEPIVRSGTLANIPEGLVETTINKKLGRVFFAEVHSFGGNSGSPIFVDNTRFSNVIAGPSYKLLGVMSGEVLESADLSLNVTTTISGSIGANSDISTVVPAGELLKILNSKKLQDERDTWVDIHSKPRIPQQPPSSPKK